MKWTIAITVNLILATPILLFSQSNEEAGVAIEFNNYLHSNTIYNSFFNEFFTERTISAESKELVMNNLKSSNRFGNLTDYQLNFYAPITPIYTFHAGFQNLDYLGAQISDDFFALLFAGNAAYKGTSLTLSPTEVLGFKYDQLYLGLSARLTKHLRIGGNLGFVKGNELSYVSFQKSDLYTSASADSIALSGKQSLSFVPYTTPLDSKGWGLSLTLTATYQRAHHRISLCAKNIGFIQWKQTTQYQSDEVKSFTGIQSDALFSADLFSIQQNNPEEILGIEAEEKSLLMGLPFSLHLRYDYQGFTKWDIWAQVQYSKAPGYLPQVKTTTLYQFPYRIKGGLAVAAGGYTRLDWGLVAEASVWEQLTIGCQTFYLESWLAPAQTTGQGLKFYAYYLW